jgi:hypothetical protein
MYLQVNTIFPPLERGIAGENEPEADLFSFSCMFRVTVEWHALGVPAIVSENLLVPDGCRKQQEFFR